MGRAANRKFLEKCWWKKRASLSKRWNKSRLELNKRKDWIFIEIFQRNLSHQHQTPIWRAVSARVVVLSNKRWAIGKVEGRFQVMKSKEIKSTFLMFWSKAMLNSQGKPKRGEINKFIDWFIYKLAAVSFKIWNYGITDDRILTSYFDLQARQSGL